MEWQIYQETRRLDIHDASSPTKSLNALPVQDGDDQNK